MTSSRFRRRRRTDRPQQVRRLGRRHIKLAKTAATCGLFSQIFRSSPHRLGANALRCQHQCGANEKDEIGDRSPRRRIQEEYPRSFDEGCNSKRHHNDACWCAQICIVFGTGTWTTGQNRNTCSRCAAYLLCRIYYRPHRLLAAYGQATGTRGIQVARTPTFASPTWMTQRHHRRRLNQLTLVVVSCVGTVCELTKLPMKQVTHTDTHNWHGSRPHQVHSVCCFSRSRFRSHSCSCSCLVKRD